MRELANNFDLTLIGRASGVSDGKLQVDGANLHHNMERIEANVAKMQKIVQAYIDEHPDELAELKSLGLTDMEVEPPVQIPQCEISPLNELDLKAAGVKSIVYCRSVGHESPMYQLITRHPLLLFTTQLSAPSLTPLPYPF